MDNKTPKSDTKATRQAEISVAMDEEIARTLLVQLETKITDTRKTVREINEQIVSWENTCKNLRRRLSKS